MPYKYETLSMDELEARLRKVGAVCFRNDDLLLLEELLRRARKLEADVKEWRLTAETEASIAESLREES